jgi:hypothetical protein
VIEGEGTGENFFLLYIWINKKENGWKIKVLFKCRKSYFIEKYLKKMK